MEGYEMFAKELRIEHREKSFKKWPFKTGSCTAKELAKAGFYMPSEKSLCVQCYYCFKELEGWEPTDIPMIEHKKHAPYCAYVKKFDKPTNSLLLKDVLELEKDRAIRKMEIDMEKRIETFNILVDELLSSINKANKKANQQNAK